MQLETEIVEKSPLIPEIAVAFPSKCLVELNTSTVTEALALTAKKRTPIKHPGKTERNCKAILGALISDICVPTEALINRNGFLVQGAVVCKPADVLDVVIRVGVVVLVVLVVVVVISVVDVVADVVLVVVVDVVVDVGVVVAAITAKEKVRTLLATFESAVSLEVNNVIVTLEAGTDAATAI